MLSLLRGVGRSGNYRVSFLVAIGVRPKVQPEDQCGYLIFNDPARPCVMRKGHKTLGHRDEAQRSSRETYRQNKKKTDANYYPNARIKHYYGITWEEYERVLAKQGGVCAVCGDAPTPDQRLSVDHDHDCCQGKKSCGKCVRGLLCRSCNLMLGNAKDSVDRLLSGAAYLQQAKLTSRVKGLFRSGGNNGTFKPELFGF